MVRPSAASARLFSPRRRGSILLLVLTLIVVVAYTLTRFIERGAVEIQAEGYYVERARLRLRAWSMLETAVATLADVKAIDGALYAPAQGWGDPVAYAGIETPPGLNVRFNFIDESGKLGINQLDQGSLFLLFDQMGFDLEESQRMTSALLDWIDEDDETRVDGAESREYSTSEMKQRPANRPLRSLEELYYVMGFRERFFDGRGVPNAAFERLASAVTHLDAQRLNANAASPLALQALAGLDELQVESLETFLAGFDGVMGTEDDNYFASAQEISDVIGETAAPGILSAEIAILTIEVTVSEGGSAYTLSGTLDTRSRPGASEGGGAPDYPFVFLEIRERPGSTGPSAL